MLFRSQPQSGLRGSHRVGEASQPGADLTERREVGLVDGDPCRRWSDAHRQGQHRARRRRCLEIAGANTGNSILHSGTVGAALTAQNFGGSGLAVSVAATSGNEWVPPGTDVTWFWDAAAELAVELLPLVVEAPERTVLNLNVPARPRNEIEVRWARLATFGQTRAAIQRGDDGRLNFDVEADERERANLAAREPDRLASLRRAWHAWNETLPPIPDDATVSLGYSVADMPQR